LTKPNFAPIHKIDTALFLRRMVMEVVKVSSVDGYVELAKAVLDETTGGRQIWPARGSATLAQVIEERLEKLSVSEGPTDKKEPRKRWALYHMYGLSLEGEGPKARHLSATTIKSQGGRALEELCQDPEFQASLSQFLVTTPDELLEIQAREEHLRAENGELMEQLDACQETAEGFSQDVKYFNQIFQGWFGSICWFILSKPRG
jgi:hypothetical protein